MSSITEMERRLKLSFRRHPLVALGLALSFVVAAAVPAGATYYTEEERPGIQTWAPFHMTEKVEFDYFRPLQGNVYKVTWTLRGECGDGSLFSSGNVSPGSFRGLEFDANAPSSLFSNYFTASDDVTTIQTTGFNGTEGVYRDTNFLDSGTARLGWGVYNAQNMTECTAGGGNQTYTVSIWVVGTVSPPANQTVVWKVHAMHEESAFCGAGMAFCMFPDFDHTVTKTKFKQSGTDGNGVAWGTSGFDSVLDSQDTNQIQRTDSLDPDAYWGYAIPDHGMPCVLGTYCYWSGWYTGGDLSTTTGPPGDNARNVSLKFGDIESDNTVSMTWDVDAPGGNWTGSPAPKASATAEVTVKCVTPNPGTSACYTIFGYSGLATATAAQEDRIIPYSIPNNGHWYMCRVDDQHMPSGLGADFSSPHLTYRWTLATSARWLAFDHALMAPKTQYAQNESPVADMHAVPGCTDIGA